MHSSLSPPNHSPPHEMKAGFTLLEVLLYLGLFGVLMTNLVAIGFMATDSAQRSQIAWDTNAEADFIEHKLVWLLDNNRVTSPNLGGQSTKLTLSSNNGAGDTVLDAIDHHLQLQYPSAAPMVLSASTLENLQLSLSTGNQLTFTFTLNGQTFTFHKQLFVPP